MPFLPHVFEYNVCSVPVVVLQTGNKPSVVLGSLPRKDPKLTRNVVNSIHAIEGECLDIHYWRERPTIPLNRAISLPLTCNPPPLHKV